MINGSFTSSKEKPNDIDLILVVDLSSGENPQVELTPFAYNALSKSRLAKRYGFDVYVSPKGGVTYQKALKLFCTIRNTETKKGILRVRL